MTEWILVLCIGFSAEHGVCGQLRQVRYASYPTCTIERDAVAKQPAVSFAYCRPAREPELVK